MTLKERIIEANKTNNIKEFDKISNSLRFGGYKVDGKKVYCTYEDMFQILNSCDCSISKQRFETIMEECNLLEKE